MALISLILEQYRGVFERIYVFSPSVNIDDGWIPVKKYIEEDVGVNTEREQTYWDEWDEAALRRIIQLVAQPPAAEELHVHPHGCADEPQLLRAHPGTYLHVPASDEEGVKGAVRLVQLRRVSKVVDDYKHLVQFLHFQLHELDAVVEELSALLPKEQLYRLYEQATREPYSFLFVYYLKPRNEMFYKRFEERFALEKDADGSGAQLPGPEAVR